MRHLVKDLIPHAPQLGLYVDPNLPVDKLENALKDYASEVRREEVVALYDATLMGSGKDGALFTSDGLVFQNNDLEPIHTVNYEDIVEVDSRRKLIGGRRVVLTVNRGRATFKLEIDFSGKPDAAQYVTRFLKEAMLRGGDVVQSDGAESLDAVISDTTASERPAPGESETDVDAVRAALEELCAAGMLAQRDRDAMLRVLRGL